MPTLRTLTSACLFYHNDRATSQTQTSNIQHHQKNRIMINTNLFCIAAFFRLAAPIVAKACACQHCGDPVHFFVVRRSLSNDSNIRTTIQFIFVLVSTSVFSLARSAFYLLPSVSARGFFLVRNSISIEF